MSEPIRYQRAEVRRGSVPISVKFLQGLGGIPDIAKSFAIGTFLMIYYNQVLGLPAAYASAALAVALLVDAVSDPLVGSWSDNFRSKLGRRHGFMYASIVPLGVSMYLLFSPPGFEDETLLIVWMAVWVVLARFSMTFFLIPWNALFAELSDDYRERSVIVTWRFLVGWVGGITFTFLMYTYVFAGTEAQPLGQLNPANYELFAVVVSLVMMGGALITTLGTQSQVRYLQQPSGPRQRYRVRQGLSEVWLALGNRDFRVLFIAVMASAVVIGTNQAFEIYMRTYFWELVPEQLRWFALSFTGGALAFATVLPLQNRFDKKYVLAGCSLIGMLNGMLLVSLRFADVLPENGDPALLWCVVASSVVIGYVGTTALIMFVSMVADTLDAQELATGLRQEGVFNSAVGFSAKATIAVGVLIAGVLLDQVIGFPAGATAGEVDADVIFRLGLMDGIVVPAFSVISIALALRYGITRERHAEIRAALDARNNPPGSPSGPGEAGGVEAATGATRYDPELSGG